MVVVEAFTKGGSLSLSLSRFLSVELVWRFSGPGLYGRENSLFGFPLGGMLFVIKY